MEQTRTYKKRQREREEAQATKVADGLSERPKTRPSLAVTDELLDEIEYLLAHPLAVNAAEYLQKGGQ